MTTKIALSDKKVIFRIGEGMKGHVVNVKLWELGVYDYGKWVANVNETQGVVVNTATNQVVKVGFRWVITSKNEFLSYDDAPQEYKEKRDLFPIKREIIVKETEKTDKAEITKLLNEANTEALKTLTDSMFKENLEISDEEFLQRFETEGGGDDVASDEREEHRVKDIFESRFCLYTKQGGEKKLYKELPCGEIHYNENGIKKIQIGYRFTGLQFII